MADKNNIGVIGLAVMGQNLVLNIESKGFHVAVYNRTSSKTDEFIKQRASGKKIQGTYTLEEFVDSLEKPRKVLLMVKAGRPTDLVIGDLLPLLDKNDIIIDGGNSLFKDTDRRSKEVTTKGIRYLGTGVSGGEYGALHGPSIMPGGDKEAYQQLENIFTDIAARSEDGPCVTYLGPGSSGHYVKMVHNAIEYAVMQITAEIYDLMRKALKLETHEIADYFEKWNEEHQAYLIEITHKILVREDPETTKPLVDVILDKAAQKGTGKWSLQNALDLGIPVPTIGSAVNARYLSAMKDQRVRISKVFDLGVSEIKNKDQFLTSLEESLYLAVVIAYAEGMALLKAASREYKYGLKLDEVASIWKDGCIIRSALLIPIQEAYKNNPDLSNLIIADQFRDRFRKKTTDLRRVVTTANDIGIAIPALSNALGYFDSIRTENLPANLIQGQRDYFGAHTYERVDMEGDYHTEWQSIHNVT